ncbi:MAG: hypothetical protein JO358_22235 [Alphaproteobacteria bacterium]|nr:hypothetical protein [Alphaproteobacteria bacterium]
MAFCRTRSRIAPISAIILALVLSAWLGASVMPRHLDRRDNGPEWVLGNYMYKDFAKQADTCLSQGLYMTAIAACRLAV